PRGSTSCCTVWTCWAGDPVTLLHWTIHCPAAAVWVAPCQVSETLSGRGTGSGAASGKVRSSSTSRNRREAAGRAEVLACRRRRCQRDVLTVASSHAGG